MQGGDGSSIDGVSDDVVVVVVAAVTLTIQ
jgi:hypothetical protein